MAKKTNQAAEPDVFGPEIQGFGTNDAILAFCLRIAGLPFVDEKAPLKNLYDLEMVKNIPGLDVRGLTLHQAVEKAFTQKKTGAIRFLFKRAKELGELLKAFEDEKKIIAARDGDIAERVMELMIATGMNEHERVLRVACVILTARTEFNGMWRKIVPTIRIWLDGPERRYNGHVTIQGKNGPEVRPAKVVSRPGFKEIPLNASPELLKRMKL